MRKFASRAISFGVVATGVPIHRSRTRLVEVLPGRAHLRRIHVPLNLFDLLERGEQGDVGCGVWLHLFTFEVRWVNRHGHAPRLSGSHTRAILSGFSRSHPRTNVANARGGINARPGASPGAAAPSSPPRSSRG